MVVNLFKVKPEQATAIALDAGTVYVSYPATYNLVSKIGYEDC
jgi:hypothetical protein